MTEDHEDPVSPSSPEGVTQISVVADGASGGVRGHARAGWRAERDLVAVTRGEAPSPSST